MSNPKEIKLAKWPFFAGDAVLLGFAWFLYTQHGKGPMSQLEWLFFLLCGLVGAALAVTPYLLEYQAAVKMVETSAMVDTISQIHNLEELARNITNATAQWQGVQEHSNGAVVAAKQIGDRMAQEAGNFAEFLQKANDTEKNTLRLEVEKLRRAEGEWLQIVVHLLDHTYALYTGGVRTGQPALIEQLSRFQNSCREAARRIGLVSVVPAKDDKFDPQLHQSPDSQAESMASAKIQDTIAAGYTYQGRLIRQPLVSLQNPPPASAAKTGSTVKSAVSASKSASESEIEPTLL